VSIAIRDDDDNVTWRSLFMDLLVGFLCRVLFVLMFVISFPLVALALPFVFVGWLFAGDEAIGGIIALLDGWFDLMIELED
jgi:hypothetical protein